MSERGHGARDRRDRNRTAANNRKRMNNRIRSFNLDAIFSRILPFHQDFYH